MESARGHVCRSCRQQLMASSKPRNFSTSTARRIIPPESPYYVDVPSSHQAYLPWQKPDKGTLPKARELFPARRPDKPSKQYLDNVTQEPLPENVVPLDELTPTGRYKVKMAEMRRAQLREGLTQLHARKKAQVNRMSRISQAKQTQRNALLAQAPREDARLTNSSIPQTLTAGSHQSIEALEAEVATAKRLHETKLANIERVQASKQAEKMDALHTLYMNARSFITTEAQLKGAIEAQFDPSVAGMEDSDFRKHANFKTAIQAGVSMWNFGPPDSVKTMINNATGQKSKARAANDAYGRLRGENIISQAQFEREQERFKKIAEKLSGGKI